MAAALHLGLAMHNFAIQEYMSTAAHARCSGTSLHLRRRLLHPGDEPGLGVEVDEDAAATFPYEPAYLPVNRLADGTVHDW